MMTPRLIAGLLTWAFLCSLAPASDSPALSAQTVTVTLHRATVRETAIEVLCALAAVPSDNPSIFETDLRTAAYDPNDPQKTLATFSGYGVTALRKEWPQTSREKLLSLWVGCLLLPGMDNDISSNCIRQLVAFAAKTELPIEVLVALDAGHPGFSPSRPLRRIWFDERTRALIQAGALQDGPHRRSWLHLAAIAGCSEVAPLLVKGVVEDVAVLTKAGSMPFTLVRACEANALLARLDSDAGKAGIRALSLALGSMHVSDRRIAIRALCASRHDLALPPLLAVLKDDATVWPKGFDPEAATDKDRAQENGGPIDMVVWMELAHLLEGVPKELMPNSHPDDSEEKNRERFEGFRRWATTEPLVFIR